MTRTVRWMIGGALIAATISVILSLSSAPAAAQQSWRTLNCAQGNGNGACHPTQYKDANGNLQDVDASHPLPVNASVTVNPFATVTTTDKGGTITSGGAAQNAIASNASRKIWCIQNDPSASEVLSVRLNGTASATTGTILQAGQQACSNNNVDTSAVSVFAATTGHRFFGFEGQ